MDTTGTITSFSPIPKTRGVTIGGDIYGVHTAGESYSLTNPDPQTLRFTLQPGDVGPYDSPGTVERASIVNATAGPSGAQNIPVGTPIAIDYQFMVQPNGPNNTFTNTASWFVTGEMHNDDTASGVATSPPFAVQLAGDRLQIVARYCPPGGNPGNGPGSNMVNMVLWTDPNPIVPGHYYDINIQTKLSNSGAGGYLDVAIDGKQVVDYSGPLGYGAGTYWMEGLYRNAGPTQTVTADFRNLTLVTGSTAIGWQGVGGTTPTTPTSPTTPINVAPSVTQASASPGTGVADNGDTITLTLGFSEAVTVTGTPTLSLNDGGKATYVSGSGTSSLVFKNTVASTDQDTSALAITGVNLPTGASIKDAGGLAANLSGAVKTFTGLQIDATPTTSTSPTTPTSPTAPTTPTTPTTPTSPVTKPVLTVADDSLKVYGRGGTVDLGVGVTTTDTNDDVTVNIRGLPKYETITSALDGQTFRGRDITLTAAQVESGLTLTSNYRGGGHPVAELTLTASATDPVTRAVATAAPQTIIVTDPRPAATTTTTSPQTTTVTSPVSSTSTSAGWLGDRLARSQHVEPVTGTAAPTAQRPISGAEQALASATSAGFLANQGFERLQQHAESFASTLATGRSQAIATDSQAGASTASQASQSFALLSQYLAGNTGRADSGQIVAAVSQAPSWTQDAILTRPR